jgi:Tetracyclin repressor-like, C-terminal domain
VSPNMMRHVEQSAQAVMGLSERGIEPALLTALVLAVDDYMIGYTLRELHAGDAEDRGKGIAKRFRDEANEPYVRYLLESGEFPILAQFVAQDGGPPSGDRFDDGLDWLLDGFARRFDI